MSQENVEIVRRAVAAINQRDIDGYLAVLHRGRPPCDPSG